MSHVVAAALALWACACGGAQAEHPPARASATVAPVAPTICEEMAQQRQRAKTLVGEGRLDRARRAIARADANCPSSRGASQALLATIERRLGMHAEPLSEAAALALVHTALGLTDPAERQASFDRARIALERRHQTSARAGLFEAKGHAFEDRVVVAGTLSPAGPTGLFVMPKGASRWLPAQLELGNGVSTDAYGLSFGANGKTWWQVKPDAPRLPFLPVGQFGKLLVGDDEGLVVFDPEQAKVVARAEPVPYACRVRGDLVICGGDEGFSSGLVTLALPSLARKAEIEGVTLLHPTRPLAVALADDPSNTQAHAATTVAKLVDLETGGVVRSFRAPMPSAARWGFIYAFQDDGPLLAIQSGFSVFMTNLDTGATFTAPFDWHSDEQWSVMSRPVFSADGRFYCTSMEGQVAVVGVRQRRQLTDTSTTAFACRHRSRHDGVVVQVPLSRGHSLVRQVSREEYGGFAPIREDVVLDDDERHAAALTVKRLASEKLLLELVVLELAAHGQPKLLHRIAVPHDLASDYARLRIVEGVVWVEVSGTGSVGYGITSGQPVTTPPPAESEASSASDAEPYAALAPMAPLSRALLESRGQLLYERGGLAWDVERGRAAAIDTSGCLHGLSQNHRFWVTTPRCVERGRLRVFDVVSGESREDRAERRLGRHGVVAVSNDGTRVAYSDLRGVFLVDLSAPAADPPKSRVQPAPPPGIQPLIGPTSETESPWSVPEPVQMMWTSQQQLVLVSRRATTCRVSLYDANRQAVWSRPQSVDCVQPPGPLEERDGVVVVASTAVRLTDGEELEGAPPAPRIRINPVDSRYRWEVQLEGEPIATIDPFATGRAIAFMNDGTVDWLGEKGPRPDALVCYIGSWLLPYEVCAERLDDDGTLARTLRGEPSPP